MNKSLLLLSVMSLLMSGCTFLGVGTAEMTGIALFHDRRDAQSILIDEKIEESAMMTLNLNSDIWNNCHINVTAYNGIVLLTGESSIESLLPQITTTVQGLHDVRYVHNHIVFTYPTSLSTRTNDSVITTRVKTAFATDFRMPGFDTNRIKVVTENGRVFLMGLVHPKEGDIAVEIARQQTGVQAVVKVFEYIY
jgi:osmotically-inducible protein OsmY